MLNENEDESIKVILVGNSGVGKTSIINRFALNQFHEYYYPTIASNFTEVKLIINNKNLILNIWDTAGQEKYRSVNKLFVKGSKIVILVYDITSRKSFEDLHYWYNFIKIELGTYYYIGLIGNKLDKIAEEEVSLEEAKKFAESCGAYFSLLSAKEDKEGIDIYFEELLKKYLKSYVYEYVLIEEKKKESIFITKQSDNNNIEKDGMCCNNQNKKKKEKKIRIIFLGAKGVGKSNIINSFRGKGNNGVYEHTNNINKINLMYKYKKKKIKIKIYDTGGDGINNNTIIDKMSRCKIFYLVFDLNKKETFKELEKWANEINKYNKEENIIITVLGNKNTIEEEKDCITKIEGETFANKLKGSFKIVSIIKKNLIKTMIIDDIEKCLNNS